MSPVEGVSVWSILNGTVINVCAVALGSMIGLAMSGKIPARFQRIILDGLGLVTIVLGVDASVLVMRQTVESYGFGIPTYGARLAMVMVGSLLVGAIIGTILRLHERIENLGGIIHEKFGRQTTGSQEAQSQSFAKGFLTASVVFCVGPLTLLGCLNNGAHGDPSYLYIKSCLDAFCSAALAASLGAGVVFSIATVLLFQGTLSVLAFYLAGSIPDVSVQLMNMVGGLILLATALMLLEIKKIPVANLLPGIFLPPLIVWITERISTGCLVTIPKVGVTS